MRESHQRVHSLAIGWSDAVDEQGRLQFWAKAAADVEVLVTDKLHLKHDDPKFMSCTAGSSTPHELDPGPSQPYPALGHTHPVLPALAVRV